MRKYFYNHRMLSVATVFSVIMNSCMVVAGAFVLSNMVNAATNEEPRDLARLVVIAMIYLLLLWVIGKINCGLQNSLLYRITFALRADVFRSIIVEDSERFHKKTVGEIMSTITNDVDLVSTSHVNLLVSVVGAVVSILAAVISMMYINPILLMVSFVVGVLYLGYSTVISKSLSSYKEEWLSSLEGYTNNIKNILSGYDVIHDYNIHVKAIEMFNKASKNVAKKKRRLCNKVDGLNNANYVVGQGIVILIVLLCSYLVMVHKMTIGELIALVQLILSVISPLQEMSSSINEAKSLIEVRDRMVTKIDENKGKLKAYYELEAEVDEIYRISLKNVCFAYSKGNRIINQLCIDFVQGKRYLIIGESGSGKSSLLGLLLRRFSNYSGEITIDGVNSRDLWEREYETIFAVVHQDVVLFEESVLDNITLFKDYAQEEIDEAIHDACLEDLIEKERLLCVLVDGGVNLSGGERQRISIARALLPRRPILLMDEPTSALDEETATSVMRSILQKTDRTCIVISHHLPDAIKEMFDYIYIMKNGRLLTQNVEGENII